jgi:uncharacterized membrane protein
MEIAGKVLYIFSRLREPSTHASLAALFALMGQQIPDSTWTTIINGLAVIFGIVGVFVKEAKPETHVEGF